MQTLVTDETGAVIGLVAERGGRAVRIRSSWASSWPRADSSSTRTCARRTARGRSGQLHRRIEDTTGDGIVAAGVSAPQSISWTTRGGCRRSTARRHRAGDGRRAFRTAVGHRGPARQTIHQRGGAVRQFRARPVGRRPTSPPGFVFDERARSVTRSAASCRGRSSPHRGSTADWSSSPTRSRNSPTRSSSGCWTHRNPSRFNGFARNGKDEDFHRGESAYDNYYGDPSLPHPHLDVIDTAPYYALRMRAGDLGTKGGLVYNENGQSCARTAP